MDAKLDLNKIAQELEFELEDVEMLIEVFLDSTDDSMINLKEAIKNNDFESIHQNAHAIKGSALNLTLLNIANIAKDIEYASKEKLLVDYLVLYSELEQSINEIK
jgi:HPt (histidine-containing phosphotransfer) domain-containing protein